eukprot:comp12290_c0_seq1/m.7120 comp12290_c0_seq1/g.7120  ORF comp12290_c0_seq1/g.7120 comp12290_c0_seq1/m.7120 type:complete len:504 (-) comp12290_c0_seq1:283-1794(-)
MSTTPVLCGSSHARHTTTQSTFRPIFLSLLTALSFLPHITSSHSSIKPATLPTPTNPRMRVELGLTVKLPLERVRINYYHDVAASWEDSNTNTTAYRLCEVYAGDPHLSPIKCHVLTTDASSKNSSKHVVFNEGEWIHTGTWCMEHPWCGTWPHTKKAYVRAENKRGEISEFENVTFVKTGISNTENFCKNEDPNVPVGRPGSDYIANVFVLPLVNGTVRESDLRTGTDGVKMVWVDLAVLWEPIATIYSEIQGFYVCVKDKFQQWTPWHELDPWLPGGGGKTPGSYWMYRHTCYYYPPEIWSAMIKVPVFSDTVSHTVTVGITKKCRTGGVSAEKIYLRELYMRLVSRSQPNDNKSGVCVGRSLNQQAGSVVVGLKCNSAKNLLRFVSMWDNDDWMVAQKNLTKFHLKVAETNACLTAGTNGTVSLIVCLEVGQNDRQLWKTDLLGNIANLATNQCLTLGSIGQPIGLKSCTGNAMQRFSTELIPLSGLPSPIEPPPYNRYD